MNLTLQEFKYLMICSGEAPIAFSFKPNPCASIMSFQQVLQCKVPHIPVKGTMAAVVPIEVPTNFVNGTIAINKIINNGDLSID